MLLHVSRRDLVIQVSEWGGSGLTVPGDLLELEIMLPHCDGVPKRHLYCQCQVRAVSVNPAGHRLDVNVRRMQFRGDFASPLIATSETTLLM